MCCCCLEKERSLADALKTLKSYDIKLVEANYQKALDADQTKVIVLDDDPTGIQTVHDIYVYTNWEKETLLEAFQDGKRMSFILTNSRGLTDEETTQIHREIAAAILWASEKAGMSYTVLSRSDSTLRGHYPLETSILKESLGGDFDGEILMPYFLEGGRYTIDNIHYVADGDTLVPTGKTEFAKDKTFGYRNSNLCKWIAEKHEGKVSAEEVVTVSLAELRNLDYAGIETKLLAMKDFSKMIVNAVSEEDVKVFVTSLLGALSKGKHFLYRSAAALAKVLGGVDTKPLLTHEELVDLNSKNGGVIVVGSHVNKTGRQLAALQNKAKDMAFVEINQHLVVDEEAFRKEMDRVMAEVEKNICNGISTAVYTRRERFDLNNGNKEDELRLAVKISDAVTSVISRLTVRPNFIIAKGGITSSEIGTKALRCRKALALGQILKGIPVWHTGEESLFPNMNYVIFPGNVGSDDALYEAYEKMKNKK